VDIQVRFNGEGKERKEPGGDRALRFLGHWRTMAGYFFSAFGATVVIFAITSFSVMVML
jgi:hypothetical protein